MKELKAIEVQLNATPDKQISLTDPDARSMKTRGTGIVGYNVQTAVDAKHHLIVAHEATNKGEEILACHEAGISAIVPKTMTSGPKAEGRFDKADFIYDASIDE